MGGIIEQDAFGQVERVAFRGVRRTMAKRMAESVAKQAQVTTMDEADVTIIKRIREKERTIAAERGVRLTYLAFVVKACTAALKRFPRLNAVLEESGDEFVLKRYYNIGIAIDTKNGLVVPNIKDADQKSIFHIAEEIVDLVDRADERRLDLRDLHGGTFTISNYGAVGGTFATPVTNYPEVALLGMGRVRELPVVREGQVVTRSDAPPVSHHRPPADRRRRGDSFPQPGHRLPRRPRPPASGRRLVDLEGCEALRQATRGCRLVLLTATEGEAEPLLGALLAPEPYVRGHEEALRGPTRPRARARHARPSRRRDRCRRRWLSADATRPTLRTCSPAFCRP